MGCNINIFCDFHHGGLARGLVLALENRLGHTVCFPDEDFVRDAHLPDGLLMPCQSGWVNTLGGFPSWYKEVVDDRRISLEEFRSTTWDVIIVTRPELQDFFRGLLRGIYGINTKIVAQTGNDGVQFDWSWIKNFMSSDYASYRECPDTVHKIWYMQELGQQYLESRFVPITGDSLRNISCFIHCWNTFAGQWQWDGDASIFRGRCPHCGSAPTIQGDPVSPYDIWAGARAALIGTHMFRSFGMGGDAGCLDEKSLPLAYTSGSLTVHMKTYDGYGFSLLQSIACGRPVIVPRGFHRYRTAGRFLIPGVTCFEAEWNSESLVNIIREITCDVDMATEYAEACYRASRGLFDFGHEAFRLKKFLEDLI